MRRGGLWSPGRPPLLPMEKLLRLCDMAWKGEHRWEAPIIVGLWLVDAILLAVVVMNTVK